MVYQVELNKNKATTKVYDNDTKIGHCIIDIDTSKNSWQISSWYVEKKYQHNSLGKRLMKYTAEELIKHFGLPKNIEYIWNGANEYVMKWLDSNFSPISKCPIAVQKYSSEDDWESHIYILNTNSFLHYFGFI